jgi:hypothetical protein
LTLSATLVVTLAACGGASTPPRDGGRSGGAPPVSPTWSKSFGGDRLGSFVGSTDGSFSCQLSDYSCRALFVSAP